MFTADLEIERLPGIYIWPKCRQKRGRELGLDDRELASFPREVRVCASGLHERRSCKLRAGRRNELAEAAASHVTIDKKKLRNDDGDHFVKFNQCPLSLSVYMRNYPIEIL